MENWLTVRKSIVVLFRSEVRHCSSPSILTMPSSKVNSSTMLLRPSQRVELGCWKDKEDKDRLSRSMVVNRGFESVLMQPEMSALFQC